MLKVYANVLLVNTVFSLLGGKILVGLITGVSSAIARFIALNVQVGLLQKTTTVANSSLAGTQLQMALLTRNAGAAIGPIAMLKTALTGLARIGLVAIAIQVAIDGMAELDRLKKSLDDIAGFSSKEYKKQVQGLSREEVNSRIIVNRRAQAQARKELQEFTGPIGAAKGLLTGRDEELRAKLVKYQIQEAVLQSARGNKTQAQIMQAQLDGTPSPITSAAGEEGRKKKKEAADKAAREAERLAEEIARQAAAASDALFTEQQRLRVLQQTNPTAKTIVEYTNQELAIQRELTNSLKEAKSEKEKASLQEVARLKSSSNLLDLQNSLNDAGKEGMQRLEDAIKTQKQELFVNGEIEKLLREKVSPERAKQIADTRLLVRNQLESLDLSIAQAEAAVEEAKARGASVTAIENIIATLKQRRSGIVGKGAELEAGIPMAKGSKTARDYLTSGLDEARANLEQLTNSGYQLVQVAGAIGDAFGNAFKGLITGSMTAQEALANFFSSIANHFADMVAKMIAEWLKAQLMEGFMGFLDSIIPGASTLKGNVGGFAGMSVANNAVGEAMAFQMMGFATGGVAPGGFKAFANGGIVAGPTLGLVGEGRYNEAIVPLPNGRSIPVELGGGMGGVSVVVNVDATGSEAAGNEGQAKALGNAISAAVQSEIIKQKRPGGLLAR